MQANIYCTKKCNFNKKRPFIFRIIQSFRDKNIFKILISKHYAIAYCQIHGKCKKKSIICLSITNEKRT